jgi:DNA processing protein
VVTEKRLQIKPAQLLEQHQQKNPHFWTPTDSEYPRLLLEIPSPPPLLYYQGQINLQENRGITPTVAIVGTRFPTEHGRRWTYRISAALAKHGFTIVSGMAAGIDGIAHQACLQAGGRTLAILGTGVDQIYPSAHRQLWQEIQEQGLLLSEYPAGTPPKQSNFPARNRIVAGLSRAALVMEAPQKSGSLITARYSNEFGRDVYILPNSPDVEEAQGCLRLIHQGAEVIIEIEQLLEMLGTIPALDNYQQLSLFSQLETSDNPPKNKQKLKKVEPIIIEKTPDLEPNLAQVLKAVTPEAIAFDIIVNESGFSTAEVSGALLQLELLGLVSQLPGMRYQRIK